MEGLGVTVWDLVVKDESVSKWESEAFLIRKGLRKREFTYGEGETKAGKVSLQLFTTELLEELEEYPCKFDNEFREREKGLAAKGSSGLEFKTIWEPGRRGGARGV